MSLTSSTQVSICTMSLAPKMSSKAQKTEFLTDIYNDFRKLVRPDPKIKNGGRGIRTPVTIAREAIFKTAAFSHSAIPPY